MSRDILDVDNFSDVNGFLPESPLFPVDSKISDEESESVQIPPLIYDVSNYLSWNTCNIKLYK